jgi:hypothetical protein
MQTDNIIFMGKRFSMMLSDLHEYMKTHPNHLKQDKEAKVIRGKKFDKAEDWANKKEEILAQKDEFVNVIVGKHPIPVPSIHNLRQLILKYGTMDDRGKFTVTMPELLIRWFHDKYGCKEYFTITYLKNIGKQTRTIREKTCWSCGDMRKRLSKNLCPKCFNKVIEIGAKEHIKQLISKGDNPYVLNYSDLEFQEPENNYLLEKWVQSVIIREDFEKEKTQAENTESRLEIILEYSKIADTKRKIRQRVRILRIKLSHTILPECCGDISRMIRNIAGDWECAYCGKSASTDFVEKQARIKLIKEKIYGLKNKLKEIREDELIEMTYEEEV